METAYDHCSICSRRLFLKEENGVPDCWASCTHCGTVHKIVNECRHPGTCRFVIECLSKPFAYPVWICIP